MTSPADDAPFQPLTREGLTVPYITKWSNEFELSLPELFLDRKGLRYRTENPEDRDEHGVLWARTLGGYGDGTPEWRKVNSVRQREAMEGLLCQICTQPASHTSSGMLFLSQGRATSAAALEDTTTGQPPLCLRCAGDSTRQCPRLRHYIAFRARKTPKWGVLGTEILPRGRHLVEGQELTIPYGTTAPLLLAGQLIRQLRRITLVDLAAELHGGCPRARASGEP